MSEALDSSAVLRLLTGEPLEQAEVVRRHLEVSAGPVFVDPLVVGECYFALRHHYRVPHREAVDALFQMLSSERIRSTPDLRTALAESKERDQPGLMDRLILSAAQREAYTLLTFDRQLAQLDGARLLR